MRVPGGSVRPLPGGRWQADRSEPDGRRERSNHATLEAARIVLGAIAASAAAKTRVGFKASGGIRTVAEAAAYLALVQQLQAQDLFPGLRSISLTLTGPAEQRALGVGAWAAAAPANTPPEAPKKATQC